MAYFRRYGLLEAKIHHRRWVVKHVRMAPNNRFVDDLISVSWRMVKILKDPRILRQWHDVVCIAGDVDNCDALRILRREAVSVKHPATALDQNTLKHARSNAGL